jgi:hypothetical protein
VTPRDSGGVARARAWQFGLLITLMAAAVGTQVVADTSDASSGPDRSVLWVRSPDVMRRLTLGFEALAADLYWIRAVQHYGSTKLSAEKTRSYDLLFPLLDTTTTLDPHFRIAYRFGAILLSEAFPNGPGRPDQAIALLEKGIQVTPERWEYYHDAGFVEYWWRQDPAAAAEWFVRAARVPGAPEWLSPVAATFLAEGGERRSAREIWLRLAESDQAWLRRTAERGLLQLDAEAVIEQLQAVVNRFSDTAGRFPASWDELVRARQLPGVPLDPTGVPYALDPATGAVDVARTSSLFPLRPQGIGR